MDPSKKIGKMKEQVEMEQMARRNYPRKWGKQEYQQWHQIYNQDEINAQLKQHLKLQDLCPFEHNDQGEGFFVSPDMYDTLLAKCRCGRTRNQTHILRCLQKEQDKYLQTPNQELTTTSTAETTVRESKDLCTVPPTTNGFIGWQRHKRDYKQWEQSMKYISPVLTMSGHRIAATPYNAIIIG